jgi:hypothetical protein
MLIIGSITTIGLYLIGLPSAVALGFLAGLAAFVPIVGPIVSFIPAIVIAVQEGVGMAVGVSLLYVTVQTIESNLILPLVQRRVVDLRPGRWPWRPITTARTTSSGCGTPRSCGSPVSADSWRGTCSAPR